MLRRVSKSHEIEVGAEFPARLPLPGSANGVAFSSDSQRLYAVDSSAVFSFARGTGERAPFARVGAATGVIAASPTEPVVACATAAAAFVFDAAGKLVSKTPLTKGVGATNAVAFSPNGSVFAVGTGHLNSKVTTLEIFASSGKRLRAIKDDVGYGITEICFTGDSKHVITIRDDPEDTRGAYFERWPVAGGRSHRVRVGSLFGADSLASAKGLVATCSRHGGVALLSEKGRVKWRKDVEAEQVAIAPDASLVVAGKGRALTVFSAAGKNLKTIARTSTRQIRALAISADGWLAIGTDGGVEMQRIAGRPAKAKAPAATKTNVALRKGGASATDAWRRIDAWMAAQKVQWRDEPNKGATQKEIAAAQKELGVPFPADLAESLRIHDGAESLIGNWSLLGASEIALEGTRMNEWARGESFGDSQGARHPRIKRPWWNVRWIPIVSSGSGHYFCVDMDPTPKGKVGQVILFFHDEEKRLLVADSVRDWLSAIARDLEAGRYEYHDEAGTWSDEAFLQSSVEGKHTYG